MNAPTFPQTESDIQLNSSRTDYVHSRVQGRNSLDHLIGTICIFAWIGLFSLGLLIGVKPFKEHLGSSFKWTDLIAATFIYTYTNVAFLTCLSGAIGGVSSRMSLHSYYSVTKATPEDLAKNNYSASVAYRSESPFASVCRSFAVYLLYIAGLAIGIPGGAENVPTTPEQYMRMAGLLSSLGFVVGYDPTIFTSLITRFGSSKPWGQAEGDQKLMSANAGSSAAKAVDNQIGVGQGHPNP